MTVSLTLIFLLLFLLVVITTILMTWWFRIVDWDDDADVPAAWVIIALTLLTASIVSIIELTQPLS